MMNDKAPNTDTGNLTKAAMVAAVYVLLTLLLMPFSFGPVQIRVSEAVCVLSAFLPSAWAGLTAGCLIANILGGAPVPDIVFGTLATFLGAFASRKLYLRYFSIGSMAIRIIACIPTIASNTVILPLVFRYAYGLKEGLFIMTGSILLGEVISVGVIGNIVISILQKRHTIL